MQSKQTKNNIGILIRPEILKKLVELKNERGKSISQLVEDYIILGFTEQGIKIDQGDIYEYH